MLKMKEGPAAWIAAGAGVIAAAAAVIAIGLGLSNDTEDHSIHPVSGASGAPPTPAASSTASTDQSAPVAPGECVREDGPPIECGSSDAWLAVAASPCEPDSVSRALGADPDEVELRIEAKGIAGACAVAPTAAARSVGATISDLTAISEGRLAAPVLTCWSTLDPNEAVSCNQPHRYEPVTGWRPLQNHRDLESVCQEAVKRFVAGPADSSTGALSTRWVTTEESFRCLVESRGPLVGTVYRLSGRPLPTAIAS